MSSVIAILAGAALSMGTSTAMNLPPLQRWITYGSNFLRPNRLPEPMDLIELRRRGLISKKEYYGWFANHGFATDQSERFWKAAKRLLDASDYLVLKWRGGITEDEYYNAMAKLGFDRDEASKYERRNVFYPSPADLIVWQAREVYEPDAIKKYGLDDELELLDKKPFYKAGMTDEQIRNYWIAHWEHPSWLRVREMLHRTDLTEEDVYEWFRLVEIPPYWRKKFTQIMYEPYTRVDVRRMHALGVLNRDEVKAAYKELGYDADKAEHLTQFTVASNLPMERDLTRTMIEKAYVQGEITREDAVNYLVKMGYDEAEANLILMLKDNAMAEDELDDKVDTIMLQFRNGVITETEAIYRLDALNLSPTYRDKVIAKIIRRKEKAVTLPAKADLAAFFIEQYIDLPTYVDYMERRGYARRDIKYYAMLNIANLKRGKFRDKAEQDFKELFP